MLAALMLMSIPLFSQQTVVSSDNGLLVFAGETDDTVRRLPVATAPQEILLTEEDFGYATAPELTSFDPLSGSLRVVTSLIVIIILAFSISWFLQKKAGFGGNVFGKILGILPLDNKRFVYLVDVMGKVLILGVTEQNINFLGEITDKNTIDSLRLEDSVPNMAGMDQLFSFLRKKKDVEEVDDLADMTLSEKGIASQNLRTRERLKKINDLIVKRTSKRDNSED